MVNVKSKRIKAYRLGHRAELLALLSLMLKGYLPLYRRYRTPVGEIDLILRRGKTLVFVEVKARPTHDNAAHAVHITNQSRVVRAAQYFLSRHPSCAAYEMRFDVCLIAWYSWPQHRTHAFDSTH